MYVKLYFSSPVYRLRNSGMASLNVKDIDEVISQAICWKVYHFKRNQEGCEEG